MSQLPPSASFHEQVQALFCFLRGHGAALCPLDAELLETWALAHVPFEVVARGLRRAFEARLTGLRQDETASLPSLRSCRRHVQSEIARYVRVHVPASAPSEEDNDVPYAHSKHLRLRRQLRHFAKKQPWLLRV